MLSSLEAQMTPRSPTAKAIGAMTYMLAEQIAIQRIAEWCGVESYVVATVLPLLFLTVNLTTNMATRITNVFSSLTNAESKSDVEGVRVSTDLFDDDTTLPDPNPDAIGVGTALQEAGVASDQDALRPEGSRDPMPEAARAPEDGLPVILQRVDTETAKLIGGNFVEVVMPQLTDDADAESGPNDDTDAKPSPGSIQKSLLGILQNPGNSKSYQVICKVLVWIAKAFVVVVVAQIVATQQWTAMKSCLSTFASWSMQKKMGAGFGRFHAKAKVNILTATHCLSLLQQAGLPFTLDVFEALAQILMSLGFSLKGTAKSRVVHVVLDNGASFRRSLGCYYFPQRGKLGGDASCGPDHKHVAGLRLAIQTVESIPNIMFIVNMAKMFVVGYTTLLNGMAEVQLCGSLRLTALNQLEGRGDDDDGCCAEYLTEKDVRAACEAHRKKQSLLAGFPCDTVPSVPACSANAENGSMAYRSWPSELKANILLDA